MSPFFACLTGPLASLVLAATIAPALSQSTPYLGRWAENPKTCSNPTDGSNDDIPITITRRSIETFASSCRILGITQHGQDVRIRTSCHDEGQADNEPRTPITFTVRISGNRLTLRDDTGTQALTRCPAQPGPSTASPNTASPNKVR